MVCRKERKRIQELLDGELGAAGKASLDGHLTGCESCRSYREQLTALGKLAGIRRLEERGEGYWTSYWPRLRPKLVEKPVRRPRPVVRLIRNPAFNLAAVSAAVLVVMLRFNLFVFEAPVTPTVSERVIAPLRAPAAYRHVLSSASRYSPAPGDLADRVVDPLSRVPHEYVLEPARGPGGASLGAIAT